MKTRDYKALREDVLNDLSDPRHGRSYVVAYSYNCSCEKCDKLRKDTIDDMRNNSEHPFHGSIRGYVYGKCRCDKCTEKFLEKTYKYQREKNWIRIGIDDFVWEDYINLLNNQNNACAVCGETIDNDKGEVDHDHNTGKVRGIVCTSCNHAVRSIEHSLSGKCLTPEIIVLALQYIMKNKEK